MVGEEVVELSHDDKALQKSAGENRALKAIGYFERTPHLLEVCHVRAA
jgi:hypothetical protein